LSRKILRNPKQHFATFYEKDPHYDYLLDKGTRLYFNEEAERV
jgi:hypothetical protein